MKYLDLTHAFRQNMPVYPGDQAPEINQVGFIDKDGYNELSNKDWPACRHASGRPLAHDPKRQKGFGLSARPFFSAKAI